MAPPEERVGTSDEPEAQEGDQSRWSTRSAIASEPQLLALAQEVPVHCCGAAVLPTVKRASLSFNINWVSVNASLAESSFAPVSSWM